MGRSGRGRHVRDRRDRWIGRLVGDHGDHAVVEAPPPALGGRSPRSRQVTSSGAQSRGGRVGDDDGVADVESQSLPQHLGRGLLAGPAAQHPQVARLRRRSAAPLVPPPDSHSRTKASERVSSVSRSMPTRVGRRATAATATPSRCDRLSDRPVCAPSTKASGAPSSAARTSTRSRRHTEHRAEQRLRRPPPEPPVGPPLGDRQPGHHGALAVGEPLVVGRHLAGTGAMPPDGHRGAPVRASSRATPRPMASMT